MSAANDSGCGPQRGTTMLISPLNGHLPSQLCLKSQVFLGTLFNRGIQELLSWGHAMVLTIMLTFHFARCLGCAFLSCAGAPGQHTWHLGCWGCSLLGPPASTLLPARHCHSAAKMYWDLQPQFSDPFPTNTTHFVELNAIKEPYS